MALTEIKITNAPIAASQITELLKSPAHGGLCYFFGAVRNQNHGRNVLAVSYDCHAPLAEKALNEIAEEARAKFGDDLDIVVFHGSGRISVGENSVGIGVSSKHRDEAFEACRYIIEQLKVRAPIWKQEHYTDGNSEWLKGHELCQHGKKHEYHSSHLSGRP